nr:hypothetical protein [Anaerolineae bacterium]NIN97140.1 hypothetical protein [Anaerolineae bacterium]NIQ81350.1 hypothetical protein [Anaerolineae bacterium]
MPRGMTIFVAILLAAVAALATALVVVAGQDGPEPPQPVLSQELLERSVPSLTVQQRQKIADIALNESRVRKLTQRQTAEVADVLVWTKSTGELLGGVVTLALDAPATIEGEWLALNYDGTEESVPPYTSVPFKAKLSNVTSLTVMVD